MRVLIVSNTYPPADISGVGSLVYELAHRLGVDDEHEVRVLTREAPASDPYAHGVGGGKGGFLWRAPMAYLGLGRRETYDLIHVHESDCAGVVFLWWLGKLLRPKRPRPKLVATLQVTYTQERRMVKTLRAGGEVLSRPTFGERIFAWLKAPAHAFFGRLTVRLADWVVAPSEATAEELVRDYGSPEPRVINNGIDLEKTFSSAPDRQEGSPEQGVVVLYVGRLRTRKAVAALLHAFRRIVADDRHPNTRLRIIGGGEQLEALRELKERWSLGDTVEIVGPLEREKTAEEYAKADIYCLPSLYEGFPLAILEAMAAGLPVVVTDVAGNKEALEVKETGLLVPVEEKAGDLTTLSQGLSTALERLIVEPERRRQMGRAGRRRVEEKFAIARIADEYLRLWEDLLAGRPASQDPS